MQQLSEKQERVLKFICSITKKIYRFIQYMGEMIKNIFRIIYNIFRALGIILIIFTFPFILPLILKFLIEIKCFTNLEDFQKYFNIFENKYVIIWLGIGMLLFLGSFGKMAEKLKEITQKISELRFEFGEKKASVKFDSAAILEESTQKKKIAEKMKDIDNPEDNQKIILEELKNIKNSQLTIKEVYSDKYLCKNCDSNKIKEENKKLRNFATINIINKETRTLLHIIYNEKYIEAEKFKSNIIKGYKRRNKNNAKLSNKNINQLANNKYETIFNGLKFLNIIEPSENNSEIMLTNEGKKFVEEYIEDEEGL